MLVLTRNIGQTIFIGETESVTVLDINGSQAKLGINAPKEVQVHREEIAQRIWDEEKREPSPIAKLLRRQTEQAANKSRVRRLAESLDNKAKIRRKKNRLQGNAL